VLSAEAEKYPAGSDVAENQHEQGGEPMIDFQAINQAALARLPELLLEQFSGGRIQGNEFICGDLAGGVLS
jgi:hypothetical protein